MALAEGGLFAAVMMVLGIAPSRRTLPPHLVLVHPSGEPVPDVIDVCPDVIEDVVDVFEDTTPDASDRPTSGETVTLPSKVASTRAFVSWWRGLDDVPAEITQRYMLGLYHEYCEVADVIPLSGRQLVNKIKRHGVEAKRAPTKIVKGQQRRPTLYRLRRGRTC